MPVPILTVAQYCGDSLKDCPIPLLQRLAVEATREVCRLGRIWTMQIPTATIIDGTSDYSLIATLPLNAEIEDCALVQINGQPILPYDVNATTPAVDQLPYQATTLPVGGGSSFLNTGFQNITWNRGNQTSITIAPSTIGLGGMSLDVKLVLAPIIGSTTVPDIVWTQYFEAIENYVKWKASNRQDEPFSNPALAAEHHAIWDVWAGQLNTKARAGNMNPRHRIVPNDWG